MADLVERIRFDDSDVIKGLTHEIELYKKVNEAARMYEKTIEDAMVVAEKGVNEATKQIEDHTQSIGQTITATNQAKAASTGWKGALKGLADEVNIMGVNLGRTVDQLRAKSNAMKAAVTGINAGTNAMKIFKVALISTGIGALVVALGSLVAFFTKTERGAEKVERVMAGVGAVVSVLIDRFSKFGESITKIFSGDFKGAADSAKAAFKGLGEELKNEVKGMVDLKRREQELEDARRNHRAEEAKNLARIKELQLLADDNTKSAKERLAAAREADTIEKKSMAERLRLDKEDLDIVVQRNAMGEIMDADLDKELEKKEQLAQGQAESLTLQRKLQGTIQGITAEQAAKEKERLAAIKENNDALQAQIDKITDAADKAGLESLDPEGRLRAEANLAKQVIEEQFNILDAAAKRAGKEIDLSEDKATLMLAVEKKLQRDIENVRNEAIAKVPSLPIKGLKIPKRDAVDIFGNVTEAVEEMPEQPEFKNAVEKIKHKLSEAFALDEDELKEAFSSIANSIGSIFESLTAGTDAAIERNDALLESIQEQQDVLDDALEKELERQELGLANNVDGKRKEIEALKKEEAAAEKEREKLRKKALKEKLIADSVSQASSLVTMGANVIQAESGKGLLGVGFALAAIAAFIAIFSQAKAASKTKLRGGGSIMDKGDFVNVHGRTDRDASRGHAVEDSNLVLGGEEFVVPGGPSHEHKDFLYNLSEGKYTGRNLAKEMASRGLHFALGHNADHEHNAAIISGYQARNKDHIIESAIKEVVGAKLDSLIAFMADKEEAFSYTPGDIVVKRKGNDTRIIETAKPWIWKP